MLNEGEGSGDLKNDENDNDDDCNDNTMMMIITLLARQAARSLCKQWCQPARRNSTPPLQAFNNGVQRQGGSWWGQWRLWLEEWWWWCSVCVCTASLTRQLSENTGSKNCIKSGLFGGQFSPVGRLYTQVYKSWWGGVFVISPDRLRLSIIDKISGQEESQSLELYYSLICIHPW